ncbi:MAG: ABC transporter permease [Acidobacteria bacterium]|nr:MAG: ABC transporter permease [Acidobacteriota bacterium]
MSWRRTKAVARKEIIHIYRDPRSLAMALAMPLVMLLLFGYALTLDVDRIPTMIYDGDDTPQSREVAELFRASRYFEVFGRPDSYGEIEKEINHSRCLLGVVIPSDFSEELSVGNQGQIQLLLDGSDSNTASIALGYAEALLQLHSLTLRTRWFDRQGGSELKVPVDPHMRVWYNPELKSKNYIVPGLIGVILMIISALLTSLTIAREWEMGTMEQLLSTPLRPGELVLGKMAAFFIIGFIDTLMAVGVGVLIFGVPFRGNAIFLIVTVSIFLFGVLCWGIMISAATRSQLKAYQLGMITSFLPAFLLSGFVYDIGNMPAIIQVITHIVPARYLVTLLKGIFLKGIGLEMLFVEFILLLVYAAAIFFIATRILHRKVA